MDEYADREGHELSRNICVHESDEFDRFSISSVVWIASGIQISPLREKNRKDAIPNTMKKVCTSESGDVHLLLKFSHQYVEFIYVCLYMRELD